MNLGIPYIHAAVAIHCDYSGYTPLCIYGDPQQRTPEAIGHAARWSGLAGNGMASGRDLDAVLTTDFTDSTD